MGDPAEPDHTAEPVEPGDWRVFGGGTPSTTRIITPEGELLSNVVSVEWRQDTNELPELVIRVRPPVAAVATGEPPLVECERCEHEHRCETAGEKHHRSMMATLTGGHVTVLPGGPTSWSPSFGSTGP